jgi:YesN/AraC family two-component response regulator
MKNVLFVDDEPKILQDLQRQVRVLPNEWDMHFIESGSQALEFMRCQAVDVVISDMVMRGMDGAQLLTEVGKRHSNTVRIVLSGHAGNDGVFRLIGSAHQYLSYEKPSPLCR